MRQVTRGCAPQPADHEPASDRQEEPGNYRERKEENPVRHDSSPVGIDEDGTLLSPCFLPRPRLAG